MTVLAFHNIGFQEPWLNLIAIVIFVGGFFVSNYYVVRAIIYLAKNWQSFSTKWQMILALLPVAFVFIASTEPIHLIIPALPFGLLGGFPAIFIFTIEFGPENVFTYKLLGFGGMLLNALTIIGIFCRIEHRRAKKLP